MRGFFYVRVCLTRAAERLALQHGNPQPRLTNHLNIRLHKVLLLAGLAACNTQAAVFTLKNQASPSLTLHLGTGGPNIASVDFNVPIANIGDGTPVRGSRRIKIQLELRTTAATPLTGYLTVDSSIPLSNGTGGAIPLSSISWLSSSGDIPPGTFSGTSNQLLAIFPGPVRVMDWHTFSFSNDALYDPGTYSGQITYTWSAP